jgi:3-isopropylmalate dehydrogenase
MEVLDRQGVCQFELDTIPCAGSYYIEHGQEWADGSLERCKNADAIILGAIGHLGSDGKPVRRADGQLAGYEQVIGIRTKLDLYANMRPIKLYPGVKHLVSGEFSLVWAPKNVDMVVFRENTEGAYAKGSFEVERGEVVESATSPTIITRKGAERICRRAFEMAVLRNGAPSDGKSRVTCVEKSNVLSAHRFFRDVFREVGEDFPSIEQDFAYVDAFCHNLVRGPENYDVLVAPNLPGDIISDLGSALQGGMGMSAGGNIGDNHAMFEPVHGSAPDIVGQEKANPIAAIVSVGMMMNWLADRHNDPALALCGTALHVAVAESLAEGSALCADVGGNARTSQAANAVMAQFEKQLSLMS